MNHEAYSSFSRMQLHSTTTESVTISNKSTQQSPSQQNTFLFNEKEEILQNPLPIQSFYPLQSFSQFNLEASSQSAWYYPTVQFSSEYPSISSSMSKDNYVKDFSFDISQVQYGEANQHKENKDRFDFSHRKPYVTLREHNEAVLSLRPTAEEVQKNHISESYIFPEYGLTQVELLDDFYAQMLSHKQKTEELKNIKNSQNQITKETQTKECSEVEKQTEPEQNDKDKTTFHRTNSVGSCSSAGSWVSSSSLEQMIMDGIISQNTVKISKVNYADDMAAATGTKDDSNILSYLKRKMNHKWMKRDLELRGDANTIRGDGYGDACFLEKGEERDLRLKVIEENKRQIRESKQFYELFSEWNRKEWIDENDEEIKKMWDEAEREREEEDNECSKKGSSYSGYTLEELHARLSNAASFEVAEEERKHLERIIERKEKKMQKMNKKQEMTNLEVFFDERLRKYRKAVRKATNHSKSEPNAQKDSENMLSTEKMICNSELPLHEMGSIPLTMKSKHSPIFSSNQSFPYYDEAQPSSFEPSPSSSNFSCSTISQKLSLSSFPNNLQTTVSRNTPTNLFADLSSINADTSPRLSTHKRSPSLFLKKTNSRNSMKSTMMESHQKCDETNYLCAFNDSFVETDMISSNLLEKTDDLSQPPLEEVLIFPLCLKEAGTHSSILSESTKLLRQTDQDKVRESKKHRFNCQFMPTPSRRQYLWTFDDCGQKRNIKPKKNLKYSFSLGSPLFYSIVGFFPPLQKS
ncbi:uncharacterized protein MONOS_3472 [Monocercomonoides exilis]|uniref:uncharacterized protein n=1 Tax=Monocercomonoides exilis TaxID=2049356 RepID=UPI00355A3510|nr:hypothetical protein MONOS_3472 [Monocercomonoides exilis]|eukprot:MONOS_3472.1-p1 / transcript=MONOS_3472.1 / gene=MONOS_3472 / organism=Monocercomonoides_exilis_PA203 / gene_product=unspecified product / transcript_product=unspecified product / location=Mono_scaffold00082:56749-59070(+) / protein_length=751 / sequence_SO=supercontig / SO=protein_coding / is_pseudo=false